jgi:HD-like signal output (HDOD) protein
MNRRRRRVLALAEDDAALTCDLVAALEADPALPVNVLRYAKSACIGRPIRVKTVRHGDCAVGNETL